MPSTKKASMDKKEKELKARNASNPKRVLALTYHTLFSSSWQRLFYGDVCYNVSLKETKTYGGSSGSGTDMIWI
eukprot:scaffold3013_cov112-Skeletonema_marinoi.AAC.6